MGISDVVFDEQRRGFALTCLRGLLRGVSVGYGLLVWHRAMAYRTGLFRSRSLGAYVVSIGNITVGGTGKTPLVIALAGALARSGHRVVVLSRGYKGNSSKPCVVSDGGRPLVPAEVSGDEPYLMAERLPGVPVVVGANRLAAGSLAVERFAPDVVVLDDGYQHLKLKRDLDVVVVDCGAPPQNSRLLPRGPLREPVSALGRADVLCLTHLDRCEDVGRIKQRLWQIHPGVPILEGRHRPVALRPLRAPTRDMGLGFLEGKSVFALSGIANPGSFRDLLEGWGCGVAGHAAFPDHHAYTPEDLTAVFREAKRLDADCVVTTAKDAVRIPAAWASDPPAFVLEIALEVDDLGGLLARIESGAAVLRRAAQETRC